MSEVSARIGFIVVSKEGALCLTNYRDGGGNVLCTGDYAYVFKSRRAANNAIARSRAYVEKHNLTAWETSYRVYPAGAP